jgi:hypothetical protein
MPDPFNRRPSKPGEVLDGAVLGPHFDFLADLLIHHEPLPRRGPPLSRVAAPVDGAWCMETSKARRDVPAIKVSQ